MPQPTGLIWAVVSVLVVLLAVVLAYDARRQRKRDSGAPKDVPPMGRVGRAILRDERDAAGAAAKPQLVEEPVEVAAAKSNGEDRQAKEKPAAAGSLGPGWSFSRILTTPSRVLGELAKAPATIADAASATGAKRKKETRIAEDAEFLPAALEILETPPSPVATALMLGICGGMLAALLWSIVGTLDIHAIAFGKIQPSGRTKVVQPLDAGRVAAIRVENGQIVKEGDVLVELDPTETAADLEALTRELESTAAESIRRKAAVAAARSGDLAVPALAFPQAIGAEARRRETELLRAEVSQLASSTDGFKAQIAEKQATKKRLTASVDARKKVIGLSKERVGMREEIKTRGAGSRALIIEAELQYENFVTTDTSERGQLAESDAAIVSLEKRLQQALDQFIAEQAQKSSEADRKRDRLEQEIIKARSKRDRTQLRAPSAGMVQQLEVSTLGQVVAAGQSVVSVVPMDAALEVEAMITNRDIGFVKQGQRATVKVEAFPFTRYGTIDAEVVRVSTDAVEDRNVSAMMDAASAARPQTSANTKSSPGQNLVFPAVLKLAKRTMLIDGKEIPLSPGMTVTVEIKTGERRAISYLLSPLGEIVSTSGRER